jgi:hypothetical protein
LAFSALDPIYRHLLRELPGRAVGVEPADKWDFVVDGAQTRPVDRSDSESRSRLHGRIGKHRNKTAQAIKAPARDRLVALVLVTLAKTYLLTSREVFRAKARSAHRADQGRNYRAEIGPPSASSRSKRISFG